ncbi:hypothetical protein [Streptomyces sp. NPDC006668]|uniref:hypothetical protein n=1 Tax=Streptomyces sp. NPDC006668 TaxID=3156903 RepID=UPI0033EDF22D
MFWIYVPGEGWVLRPGPFAPSSGCVPAPDSPRSFGFASPSYFALSLAAGLALAWLYLLGHEVEVVAAMLAAALAATLVELARPAMGHLATWTAERLPKGGAR